MWSFLSLPAWTRSFSRCFVLSRHAHTQDLSLANLSSLLSNYTDWRKIKRCIITFERAPNKKKAWHVIYLALQKFNFILYGITLLTLIRCNASSCQLTQFIHDPNTCWGNWRELTWYFMRINIRLSVRSSFMVGVVHRTKQHSKQLMALIMETHKSLEG